MTTTRTIPVNRATELLRQPGYILQKTFNTTRCGKEYSIIGRHSGPVTDAVAAQLLSHPECRAVDPGLFPGIEQSFSLYGGYEATLRERRERYGATIATVENLMFSLREQGEPALRSAVNQRRLSELTPDQLREVIERLDRMRTKFSAVTDELLLRIWEKIP